MHENKSLSDDNVFTIDNLKIILALCDYSKSSKIILVDEYDEIENDISW